MSAALALTLSVGPVWALDSVEFRVEGGSESLERDLRAASLVLGPLPVARGASPCSPDPAVRCAARDSVRAWCVVFLFKRIKI